VYDPTLDSDTFVIQNLYVGAGSDDFVGSLAKLEEVGSIYLDPDKVDTMFGNFYRMVLFSDRKQYSDYYHARRSAERFREESLIIAERTGDPKLKEDLAKITRENTGLKSVLEEREREVRTLSTDLKTVRGTLSLREKTIEELRTHKEERLSTDVVLKDMALQNRKVDHDFQKLDVDLEEINLRRDTARSTHRASTLKATGEILKSGWGITTTCVGGLLALWALCRKYNIAITMGK
jgi:vacuolar-type H+-ATPase subunit I/STV1